MPAAARIQPDQRQRRRQQRHRAGAHVLGHPAASAPPRNSPTDCSVLLDASAVPLAWGGAIFEIPRRLRGLRTLKATKNSVSRNASSHNPSAVVSQPACTTAEQADRGVEHLLRLAPFFSATITAGTITTKGQQHRRQVDLPVLGDRQAAAGDQAGTSTHRGLMRWREHAEVEPHELAVAGTSEKAADGARHRRRGRHRNTQVKIATASAAVSQNNAMPMTA